MSRERLTRLAMELMQLGVSHSGVRDLLAMHDPDEVERQLAYLPHRPKPRRPSAFIVEAVRNRYSPPPTYFYAKPQNQPTSDSRMDESPELPAGSASAEFEGQ